MKSNNLKQIRLEKNISATELAYKAGVSERHILFIESGDRNPSIKLAFKIAEILNCPIDDIFLPAKCTKSTS